MEGGEVNSFTGMGRVRAATALRRTNQAQGSATVIGGLDSDPLRSGPLFLTVSCPGLIVTGKQERGEGG